MEKKKGIAAPKEHIRLHSSSFLIVQLLLHKSIQSQCSMPLNPGVLFSYLLKRKKKTHT